MQHLAILLRDFVKELAKRTQHLATSEYAATKMWPFFKLDPNVCNTRRATMLRLAGPLYTCHVESTIFQGSIKYIHTFLHSLVRITSLFFRGGGSIRKPDRSTNLSVVKLKALKLRHMYVLLNEFLLNDLAITLNTSPPPPPPFLYFLWLTHEAVPEANLTFWECFYFLTY